MTNRYLNLLGKLILLINLTLHVNGYAPKLILISFDGFRADYLHPKLTPTMARLAKEGVQALTMRSMYCTKTFPNHFSIATGLYEENHGIVNNKMYDPELKTNFTQPNLDEEWWNDMNVNPIWNLNEDFNAERVSASSMWPGSPVKYNGKRPKIVHGFERNISYIDRVEEVVQWMTRDVDPANFVLLYIDEPDETSHQTAPFSPQVRKTLRELDLAVLHLMKRLNETGLLEETNLIILSDHGMSEVREEHVIDLTKLCDSGDFITAGVSPNLNLFFYDKANIEKVYEQLLNASQSLPFSVWRKAEVPAQYHFSSHRRIGDLVLEADNGFEIVIRENPFPYNLFTAQELIKSQKRLLDSVPDESSDASKMTILEKFDDFLLRKNRTTKKFWGEHGYNSSLPDMRPLFMANGPAFKKNYVHRVPFLNVDVYSLVCSVLHLNLDPNLKMTNPSYCRNDGEPWRVQKMLEPIKYAPRNGTDKNSLNLFFILLLGVSFLFVSGLCLTLCTSAVRSDSKRRKIFNLDLNEDVIDIDLSQYVQRAKRTTKFRYEEERENLISGDNMDYV